MKINDIDVEIFDFKSAVEQQALPLPVDTLYSEREYDNLLLMSSTSIRYTE